MALRTTVIAGGERGGAAARSLARSMQSTGRASPGDLVVLLRLLDVGEQRVALLLSFVLDGMEREWRKRCVQDAAASDRSTARKAGAARGAAQHATASMIGNGCEHTTPLLLSHTPCRSSWPPPSCWLTREQARS